MDRTARSYSRTRSAEGGAGRPTGGRRAAGGGSRTGGNARFGANPNDRSQSRSPRNGGGGGGRRPAPAAAPQEFTPPVSATPSLPAVDRFADLDLPAALLDTLTAQGLTSPFPIQGATLPNTLAGRDALGRGRTGSGKTLAFGLALLGRTAGRRAQPMQPLALVLVPTRELAQQVTDALTPYARAVRLRLTTVVGGLSLTKQARALRAGAEVVVATPGRLADLVDRGDCRLDQVRITVLDEADQMTDMGFAPQVTALLDQVAPDGQTMLFSATLDRNVDRLVRRYLNDPVVHSVDPSAGAVSTMEHHLLQVRLNDKDETATRIAAREGRVIMFLDTKRSVDKFTTLLLNSGVRAAALHGGKSQPQRNRTLDRFKTGEVTVLVATNVAARGIHVDDLDLVVNVDLPIDHKDYLHRGGRTARAGQSGRVVTLVLPHERRTMERLMADARITPKVTQVQPGDAELARITGARTPSGIPVVLPAPAPQPAPRTSRPRTGGGAPRTGGAPRSGASRSGGPRTATGASRTGGSARRFRPRGDSAA